MDRLLYAVGLMIGAPLPAAMPAGLLETRTMSAALSLEIAQRSVDACAASGFAVSASIADSAGDVRTTISSDGVSALSIETARRKARTAAIVGNRTSEIEKAVAAAPPYAAMLIEIHPDLLLHGGGVPIRFGGAVIGAVGVGGAPDGDKDEDCAQAALKAVADRIR